MAQLMELPRAERWLGAGGWPDDWCLMVVKVGWVFFTKWYIYLHEQWLMFMVNVGRYTIHGIGCQVVVSNIFYFQPYLGK